jgi:glucose-6-phosphate-specific signal transduction histidine kinase
MKAHFFASRPALQRPLALAQQMERSSGSCSKVPLHHLVNQLLMSLQPLAMKRGNLILNGIVQGLSIETDENLLAYVLWELINNAVNSTKNECIHIVTLVGDDRLMICVKDVGPYFYQTISREYRRIQDAAEKLGGNISLEDDVIHGSNISFSILNPRMAA